MTQETSRPCPPSCSRIRGDFSLHGVNDRGQTRTPCKNLTSVQSFPAKVSLHHVEKNTNALMATLFMVAHSSLQFSNNSSRRQSGEKCAETSFLPEFFFVLFFASFFFSVFEKRKSLDPTVPRVCFEHREKPPGYFCITYPHQVPWAIANIQA